MKAFKKLAAIVLAGVMALAVLTGCSSDDKDTFQKKLDEALTGTDAVNYSYSYSTCGKNMEFNDQTGKFETGNFIVLVYEVK